MNNKKQKKKEEGETEAEDLKMKMRRTRTRRKRRRKQSKTEKKCDNVERIIIIKITITMKKNVLRDEYVEPVAGLLWVDHIPRPPGPLNACVVRAVCDIFVMPRFVNADANKTSDSIVSRYR